MCSTKIWREGESVRVYPELCGKDLDDLNDLFWSYDEFCEYDDRSEAMRQAHQLFFEIELDICSKINSENQS